MIALVSQLKLEEGLFGRFDIVECLHEGANHLVYRARCNRDKIKVILKIPSSTAEAQQKKLQHEFYLLQKFASVATNKALELTEIESRLVLVSEDLALVSLAQRIERAGLPVERLLQLAIKLGTALKALHATGIVHKQINPSNILVNADQSQLKIIDFGLADIHTEQKLGFELPSILQKSLAYISPEQTGRTNTYVDHRTDLYSLGVTLYILATGNTPFTSEDNSELVYAHIAKAPAAPSERVAGLASGVNQLILNLLSKDPDNRYQSADALLSDLKILANALSEDRALDVLLLSDVGMSRTLTLSKKLFGRSFEQGVLFKRFENCADECQIAEITGNAGIGKSSLIRQLYVPITQKSGFFLSSKFDQLIKSHPYSAITHLIDEFLEQLNSLPKISQEKYRHAIQLKLGMLGQIVLDVAPRLETLIGPQVPIGSTSPKENLKRRNLAFCNLFRGMTEFTSPVVLFVDDLQWADTGSLVILEAIIAEALPNLMLLLSYRNEEVSAIHPSYGMLSRISSYEVRHTKIHLEALNESTTREWLAELVGQTHAELDVLTTQVFLRTQGNPFHINTLLNSIINDRTLFKDEFLKVRINIEQLAQLPNTSVLVHLKKELKGLSPHAYELIQAFSVLGCRFSTDIMQHALGRDLVDLKTELAELIASRLIQKSDLELVFVHDQIQQAALVHIGEAELKKKHLRYGRLIRKHLEYEGKGDKKDFALYLHHYNAAKTLITDSDERRNLAELNMHVARDYMNNAAYASAKQSFQEAADYFPEDIFASNHDLAVELYSSMGETKFLSLELDAGNSDFDLVLQHAKTVKDRAQVAMIKARHYSANRKLSEAMDIIIEILAELDLALPTHDVENSVRRALNEAINSNKTLGLAGFLELPEMTDSDAMMKMHVLGAALLPVNFAAPHLHPVLISHFLSLSRQYGVTSYTSLGLMSLARILSATDDIPFAIEAGETALRLSEKLDSTRTKSQLYNLYACTVAHFSERGRDVFPFFDIAIDSAVESGDYEYGSIAASQKCFYRYNFSPNIIDVLDALPAVLTRLQEFGKNDPILMVKFLQNHLSRMTAPDGCELDTTQLFVDEDALLHQMVQQNNLPYLCVMKTLKLQLLLVYREMDEAVALRLEVKRLLQNLPGVMLKYSYYFSGSLVALEQYRRAPDHVLLAEVNDAIDNLKRVAEFVPENYKAKYLLLEAELMALEPNSKSNLVVSAYELAIDQAVASKVPIDCAIAHECFAHYLFRIGFASFGLLKIKDALKAYQAWGCLSKVTQLKAKYNLHDMEDVDVRDLSEKLDLDALSESIEQLTEAHGINQLLEKLLLILQRSSGATSASLILLESELVSLKAFKIGDQNSVVLKEVNTSLSSYHFDSSVVHRCLIEAQSFSVENYSRRQDAFSSSSGPLSVLGVSLKQKESIVGMIYLENNLLSHSFKSEQIRFLSLVAGQAAIALENVSAFQKVAEAKNYNENIVRSASSMICGLGIDGIINFSNPATEVITGYDKIELQGRNFWHLLFPDEKYAQVDELFREMKDGVINNYELKLQHKTGKQVDIIWNSFTNFNEAGKAIEIIGFATDITTQNQAKQQIMVFNKELTIQVDERTLALSEANDELQFAIDSLKETQEQLIESEKMASLGSLVSGIAHQINTPIGIGVTAMTHLVRSTQELRQAFDNQKLSELQLDKYIDNSAKTVDLTYENLKRAGDLVANFKLISVDQASGNSRRFNVAGYITEILTSMQESMKEHKVNVSVSCPEELVIDSHPGQYTLILTQLINNSLIHAFSGENENLINIDCSVTDGHLNLVYQDNGGGISEQNIKKIFDPFFTTAKGTGGVGLGLHILYNIVTQKLNGRVGCESELGKWSRFDITVPLDS